MKRLPDIPKMIDKVFIGWYRDGYHWYVLIAFVVLIFLMVKGSIG